MMTSSNRNIFALLAICAGNSSVTGEFPTQRPVAWSFEAGDFRRRRAHYDATVTVMETVYPEWKLNNNCISALLY